MPKDRKIEIINIDLSMDIEAEIKRHADGLDNLDEKKQEIIENAKARAKPLTKRDKENSIINDTMCAIFEILKKQTTNPYLPMDNILSIANIKVSDSDLIKIGTRLKTFVATASDNKWILDKKKIHGKTYYAVARLGD